MATAKTVNIIGERVVKIYTARTVGASTNASAIKGKTVDDSAIADGYVLAYDSGTDSIVYVAGGGGGGSLTLDGLTDTNIISVASGEVLTWDGTDWINQTLSEAGIAPSSHVTDGANPHSVTAAQVGNETAQWNADKIQGVSVDATQLASPSDGDILVYRDAGSDFVLEAKPVSGSNPAMADISDVDLTGLADGNMLVYNETSGNWEPATVGTGNVNTTSLNNRYVVYGSGTDIASSGVYVGPDDDLLSVNSIKLDAIAAPTRDEATYGAGSLFFDTAKDSLTFWNSESDVSLNIGEETWIKCRNISGSTITNGSLVYISGADSGYSTIELAKADETSATTRIIGMATHDIENNSNGYVTRNGTVRDLDTSSYSAGDKLYLSATTAGAFTDTKPSYPNYIIEIGCVKTVNATTGEICFEVTSRPEDIHDNFFNGTFLESFDFTVTSDGTTITGNLERDGGGNLTANFSDGFYVYDTTPADTVTLTAGTSSIPTKNFVYLLQSDKTLTASTSDWPSTEHIKVAEVVLLDAASTQTDGALGNQNWNDHLAESNGIGHAVHIGDRLRKERAIWDSGVTLTTNIDSTPSTDFTIDVTSGKVWQLHKQTFPQLQMSVSDDIHIVNHPSTPYVTVTNLNGQTSDANGDSLSNKYFNFVIWGVQNRSGENSHLMCNLPTGSYTGASSAETDADQTSVYSIPNDFRGTGFLIARLTLQLASGTWTLHNHEDLRGLEPSTSAGGGTAASSTTTFPDSSFQVYNSSDNTKIIDFDASAITTGNARTIIMADADVNLADIATNNAKVTNATHTGDVTGSTELTIADNAVTTTKIADLNVTEGKIASNAVTSGKLATNSITTDKITDANVTTAKIADDNVTYAKIQNVVADNVILGNNSGAGGVVDELTGAEVRTIIGNTTAQWNADKIQGKTVDDTNIANGYILKYNSTSGNLEYAAESGGGGSLTVKEEDGTPSVSSVTEIKVTNGTLTDNGSGSVSITTGGGSSIPIEEKTSDYAATDANDGKMWMRTDAGAPTVKTVINYDMDGAWSINSNSIGTARYYAGWAGTESAALLFGGYNGTTTYASTEEYDGTSWSAGGDLGTAVRTHYGCGTQSAGLSFGGYLSSSVDITEEYNGSTWSTGGSLSTARQGISGCGTQTAGLSAGGYTTAFVNVTEEYDGTSWSSGGALGTSKSNGGSCGTQSAGLYVGGNTGSITGVCEEYNGTSWSAGGTLNTSRQRAGACGTQSDCLSAGGDTGSVTGVTEIYNGTAWSSGNSLNTARQSLGATGTTSTALSFGGTTGSATDVVEDYTSGVQREVLSLADLPNIAERSDDLSPNASTVGKMWMRTDAGSPTLKCVIGYNYGSTPTYAVRTITTS